MSEGKPDYKARKFYDPMDDILDRPIAYNPAFKRITGSTVAAIFLSQCWYWSKRNKDKDGWFWKTGKEWEEETGLSRSEQETARSHCKRLGVVEEKLRGVPATMYYRVIRSKVYQLIGIQFAGMSQTENAESHQPSRRESSGPDWDELANLNKEPEITTEISSENDSASPLLAILVRAGEASFTNPAINPKWRVLRSDLEAGQLSRADGTITISGMGDSAEVYQDNYALPLERALVGICDENLKVRFLP